jgi:GNAT superfamily N-acetyltransferase
MTHPDWRLFYVEANTDTDQGLERIWIHRLNLGSGVVDLGFYGGDVWLDRIEVFEKRKGYGTKLVQLALAHARELGVKQVHLYSLPTKEATAFWGSFGLEQNDSRQALLVEQERAGECKPYDAAPHDIDTAGDCLPECWCKRE